MSKIRRGGHSAEGETLSAGRVEYLEAARARVRTRRIRRTVIIVAVLTILVLFATGAVGSSIARAKDLVDTAVIALAPAAGWPQQTGITDPDAVAQMSGSFVEMGGDSCVVYSLGGTRLNSIQSGYARPAIAAGKTRFVLYNRSGNELRVESRTQNLYTKTMDSTISLCAVADAGQVAVVTDSTDSLGGTRLNSIQSGYARPAIAAGKTRFVLYNRSGNELRVESRTQNLYTKTMDSTISLCAVADAGQVAVVTDSTDSVAKLTVYNSSMQQQLVWNLTSEQGTPLRMAFAPDSRRLAVAAVSAVGGQLTTNLYVLPLSQGDPVCIGSENSVPQWMGWLSNGFLLVLYENRAVLYNTSGGSAGERASYDFGGGTLVSVSNTSNGAALLLSNGQTSTAVLLDGELTVGYSGSVLSASQIIRAKNDGFYLLTDSTVERFNGVGEFQWSQPLSARPRALIEGKQIMVLSGNTVQVVTPPEQTASSGQ